MKSIFLMAFLIVRHVVFPYKFRNGMDSWHRLGRLNLCSVLDLPELKNPEVIPIFLQYPKELTAMKSETLQDSSPEKFERCHRDDPDLDSCLKLTIQNALTLIRNKGISSLDLPSIDPLEVTRVEIGAGNSAVKLVQKYFDIQLLGFSTSVVEKAHLDLDKKVLTFAVHLPKLEQKAKYEIDGKVMLMPMFGKGDSLIQLFDVTLTHVLTFEEETKRGKSHFKVKSYKLSVNPNGAHYHFDNLFNGDKQLADNILKVLNDNWKEIFDDVKEGLEMTYAEVFKLIANRLFNYVPVHEIFLT